MPTLLQGGIWWPWEYWCWRSRWSFLTSLSYDVKLTPASALGFLDSVRCFSLCGAGASQTGSFASDVRVVERPDGRVHLAGASDLRNV